MKRPKRFELGCNWGTNFAPTFSSALEQAAKNRGVRSCIIGPDEEENALRKVEKKLLRIGLFLNTQAPGTQFDGRSMKLCRALKASGTLLVEDPDDAHIYSNRALQFEYLQRAGIKIPPLLLLEDWSTKTPLLSETDRRKIGEKWIAEQALRTARARTLSGNSKQIARELRESGFSPGDKIILRKRIKPYAEGDLEYRIIGWNFLGQLTFAFFDRNREKYVSLSAGKVESWIWSELFSLMLTISRITGLNWFSSRFVLSKAGGVSKIVVIDPADPLACLGPGQRAFARLPEEILVLAAQQIVYAAWRRSQGMSLQDGSGLLFL